MFLLAQCIRRHYGQQFTSWSPLTHMQFDFKSWNRIEQWQLMWYSKCKVLLKSMFHSNSLIRLLLSIFTVAVGRVLKNSQQCILCVAATEITITLVQMDSFNYLLYDAYSDQITALESFSINDEYVRNSQDHQNSLGCWFRVLELKWKVSRRLVGATAVLISEIRFLKQLCRCANTTYHHSLWRNPIVGRADTTAQWWHCAGGYTLQIWSLVTFKLTLVFAGSW